MKMIINSFQTPILVALALLVAFTVSLKAQDSPQDYLDVHNRARAAVGVQPIKWHNGIAKDAWDYAQQRRDCQLIKSGGHYGENLLTSSGPFSGRMAVREWVKQKRYYFHGQNKCQHGKFCKNYVQVVWRKSEWLGCAKVRCHGGGTFVICYYDPPGNIRGFWPY